MLVHLVYQKIITIFMTAGLERREPISRPPRPPGKPPGRPPGKPPGIPPEKKNALKSTTQNMNKGDNTKRGYLQRIGLLKTFLGYFQSNIEGSI